MEVWSSMGLLLFRIWDLGNDVFFLLYISFFMFGSFLSCYIEQYHEAVVL